MELFKKSQEYLKSGDPVSAIYNLINSLDFNLDLILPVVFEVDRIARVYLGISNGLTFSKSGFYFSDVNNESFNKLKDKINFINSGEKSIIHRSLRIDSNLNSRKILQEIYENCPSNEANAINLIFANLHSKNEKIWLYFLNKYLKNISSVEINLIDSDQILFEKIISKQKYIQNDGPLVSVLMPVFNSELTLSHSVNSILNQSWRNLEIILIDDASTDDSWSICEQIRDRDDRVKIVKNKINVGPYASKNIGLQFISGDYITCHDSDDWALPDRIFNQVNILTQTGTQNKATVGCMLRLSEQGLFNRPSQIGPISNDGFLRKCFVSLMCETKYFIKHVGAWDNVRSGADAEIISRLERLAGSRFVNDEKLLLIARDHKDSITNSNEFGLYEKKSINLRDSYKKSFSIWHKNPKDFLKMQPNPTQRKFDIPKELIVSNSDISKNFKFNFLDGTDLQNKKISSESAIFNTSRILSKNGIDTAVRYMELYLSRNLKYTSNAIQANNQIKENNINGWLLHLNNYLNNFNLSSVVLGEGINLFDRFQTADLEKIKDGPLVTVIMPAWNSASTIRSAVHSIINQTWVNLELIIVNDASTDNTMGIINELAKADRRVKVITNMINVGPYVSKNIALLNAKGEYITGHDADDWAHPQRIALHMNAVLSSTNPIEASITYMLRLLESGEISSLGPITSFTPDGVARKSMISCLFNAKFLREHLGYWDSVRFGGDSEMIERARFILGDRFKEFFQIGMLCLDLESSLTNDPIHGIKANNGKLADSRSQYRDSWTSWHKNNLSFSNAYLPLIQDIRRYDASPEMMVDKNLINKML